MRNSKQIFFAAFFLILGSSVFAQNRQVRSVGDFTRINAGGSWNVVLKKGEKNEVLIEAKNLDLDKVITEVKNNTLDIRLEKGNYRNIDLEVTVTYTNLEAVHSSGSGNLKSIDELKADEMEITLSGSGNATFKNVAADELSIAMSGSGDLNIQEGMVNEISIGQSGSGNLKAMDLTTEDAEINKSGSGNVSLTVNRTLSVKSSGSGNVNYNGNPTMNDIRISGSGRVVRK